MEQDFNKEHKNLTYILASMQNLALYPSETLVIQPLTPVEIIQSAILMRETIPYIYKHADKLKADLQELLTQADKEKTLVLLSHTPLYAEEAAAGGSSLMFSGHTHNGQIFPFNGLVRLQFPRVYGLHEVEKMKFYITSGMFYWGIPLRFLAPAEIPIIEVN